MATDALQVVRLLPCRGRMAVGAAADERRDELDSEAADDLGQTGSVASPQPTLPSARVTFTSAVSKFFA